MPRARLTGMSAEDGELLVQWRAGEASAGELLFERYYDSVVRFFRNKVSEDAPDLVQQTFAACLHARDRIARASNFRAYLFAVAHNTLRGHLRRTYSLRNGAQLDQTAIADLVPGPSTVMGRKAEHLLLLDGLRRLPLQLQVLLELRYWEELRTREIAEILELPHDTVRTRLRRGIARLRQVIGELPASPREHTRTIENLDHWASEVRGDIHTKSYLVVPGSKAPSEPVGRTR